MDRELQRRVEDQLGEIEGGQSRRQFLAKSAIGVGGLALFATACTSDGEAASATTAAGENQGSSDSASLFDRIRDGDTIRVGADLTFPPLQFRDDAGEPGGYTVELAQEMLSDLNPDVTLEFVEIPFGELFGALAAGRFDMSAIGATILPSRAQQVMFASEPLFIENNIVLRNVDSPITHTSQLDSSDVRLAVLAGSSQEAVARQLFSNAELVSLEQQPAIQEAATGRADAVLIGEFNVVSALEENSDLTVMEGPPLFASINTWFMPIGDFRMQAWVDNWLRYRTIQGRLSSFWIERVAAGARELGVPSVPVYSPWLGAAAALDQ